jgi:hypothetical protein
VQIAELLAAAGKDRPTKEEPCALRRITGANPPEPRREDAASGGDSRRDLGQHRSAAS